LSRAALVLTVGTYPVGLDGRLAEGALGTRLNNEFVLLNFYSLRFASKGLEMIGVAHLRFCFGSSLTEYLLLFIGGCQHRRGY